MQLLVKPSQPSKANYQNPAVVQVSFPVSLEVLREICVMHAHRTQQFGAVKS